DSLRRAMGRKGSRPRLPDKIHIDVPERADAAFAKAFDVHLVELTTTQWEFWFGLLEQFVELNRHAHVGYSETVDGYRLGSWVALQRVKYAKGTLDADRQLRLQNVPGWTWDPYADKWEQGFSRLEDYVKRHGDARVPQSYTVDDYR